MNNEEVKKEILTLLGKVERPGMDSLIADLITQGYFESPGSTKYHGAYPGGLAEHSLKVYKLFDKMCNVMKLDVPKETRIICALLHDTCKIGAYVGESAPYSYNKAQPQGHGYLSLARIKTHIPLEKLEEEIIIYHMGMYGSFEFNSKAAEYSLNSLGSVFNENKIAKLFHYCDDICSQFLEV